MSEFTGKTYEMLKRENAELKRVNKAKHEMYEEQKKRAEVLQKALELACEILESDGWQDGKDEHVIEKDEWKTRLIEQARKEIE